MGDAGARDLLRAFAGVFTLSPAGETVLLRPEALQGEATDRLVRSAVFGGPGEAAAARWLVRDLARIRGILPASIQTLYEAMGRGETGGFTTPALNLRGMAYDMARAAFRALLDLDAGPVVFELARSEMRYASQTPEEYATVILAAALREGYSGPLFIQGDHFQLNAKKFRAGNEAREGEMEALRGLVADAVRAGFYNIDIDASTLVALERGGVEEQQRDNFEIQAELTAHVRRLQPPGVVVSVGGEIGEVGGKNSTPDELRAFVGGLRQELLRRAGAVPGISKVSIQTGTTHGGLPLPDGTVARVDIDFACLRTLSDVARREYGLAGAVQHGASTLPAEAFGEFPKHGAAEVHLATEFQNIALDHPEFPGDLRAAMYAWVASHCAADRKAGMTDAQFFYKARKNAWGPFKAETWGLPEAARGAIGTTLRAKFESLFRQLGVAGRRAVAARFVAPAEVRTPPPALLVAAQAGAGSGA